MKKIICLLLCFTIFASFAALPAGALFTPPFEITAPAAYIVNTDSNIIVYEKNSETPYPAASLTKVMTVILMLEQYQDQLDEVTATMPRYVQDTLYGQGMATADIRPGETHTLRNLLYACLLPSAGEAAMTVADLIGGGSQQSFVYMMNAKAEEIGCKGTTFVDAVGMSLDNVTTARDIYLILRYAMSFDAFKTACKETRYNMGENPRYSTGAYNIQSTDVMVMPGNGAEYYRSYCQGGKTGSLGDWQNFASWHTGGQNGETYISVVLNTPISSDPYNYNKKHPAIYETGLLMDWVFDSFAIQPALDKDEPIHEVPVKYSTDADTLMLYPADDLKTILPLGTDSTVTQKTFNLPEFVAAPVKQGDVIGTVSVSLSGEVIGTVELLADRDLTRNPVLYTLAKIGEFFTSLYFKVVLVLAAIAVVIYLVLYFYWLIKRRGSKKVRRGRY